MTVDAWPIAPKPPTPRTLTITNGGTKKIIIDLETGKVDTFGMPMDEAAKEFWRAVQKAFPIGKKEDQDGR